jgi:prepilin peptidase CpaA
MLSASVASTALLIILLTCATAVDQHSRRIPNFLSFGGAALGIASGFLIGGVAGVGQSLLGLTVGLLALLPMYATGAMGAGDVKLMAAAGSFLGPAETVDALAYTFIAGGLLALITVLRADGLRGTLDRYWFGIRSLVTTRTWLAHREGAPPAERLRFPYALAILIGVSFALLTPPLFFKSG